ncbi:hypothetical protein B0H63DRAFT_294403 [Podospora didyma]|uniref:Uncharacterized protein n=1 Tax=Podospora didyma TaxID=330526 RepID=A0AAE0KAA6_9PEZI|nr:hypothetical protein B0H63DRAFT_294403 [Podospora didyma]
MVGGSVLGFSSRIWLAYVSCFFLTTLYFTVRRNTARQGKLSRKDCDCLAAESVLFRLSCFHIFILPQPSASVSPLKFAPTSSVIAVVPLGRMPSCKQTFENLLWEDSQSETGSRGSVWCFLGAGLLCLLFLTIFLQVVITDKPYYITL